MRTERVIGVALIVLGALLVLPQIVVDFPEQRLVVAGLILAIVGGIGVADNPRPTGGPHGYRSD